jgi:hypothetical protein
MNSNRNILIRIHKKGMKSGDVSSVLQNLLT